jgi:phage FluMu gp28-like protein
MTQNPDQARSPSSTLKPSESPSASKTRRSPLFRRVVIEKPAPPAAAMDRLMPWMPYQQAWMRETSRLALVVKASQIGYSTATGAWAISRAIERNDHLIVVISASEAQAKEFVRRAKQLVNGLKGVEAHLEDGLLRGASALEHSLAFPNGSRIVALSANPQTSRGYSGGMVLDEFAHHQDGDRIFTSTYRQITNENYKMRILSTPNGQQGKFYRLAKALDLTDGRPFEQPTRAKGWVGYWTDATVAQSQGFRLDLEALREGCGDENIWLQEYCCDFLAADAQWVPSELIEQAIDEGAHDGYPSTDNGLFAGWDVARKHDLSVLWFIEPVGDVLWTRGILVMRDTSTPEQLRQVRALMPAVQRLTIDKSGMGLTMCETLEKEFGGKVEGVQFTQATKEVMAVSVKRLLEEHRVRLPNASVVEAAFRSVRRIITPAGTVRFDADYDDRHGHADHFWAFALAAQACGYGTPYLRGGMIIIGPKEITAAMRGQKSRFPDPLPPHAWLNWNKLL